MEDLIVSLGLKVAVRWYRIKRMYKWQGIDVHLWATKGYGDIIELEKMAQDKEKEKVHQKLTRLFESLNIKITPRQEFEKKLNFYKKHWQKLTRFGPKRPRFPS